MANDNEVKTKDSVFLKPAFKEACEQIKDYILHGVPDAERQQAKVIVSTIGAYTRLRAVESHEAGITLVASRIMASNTDELKDLIRKSLPEFVSLPIN